MQFRDNRFRVDRIPPVLLADAWPKAYPLLVTGAQAAKTTALEITAQLMSGDAELWIISDVAKHSIAGAFITTTGDDHLFMSALAGKCLWAWFGLVRNALIATARYRDLGAVRFYGRRAYGRLYPDCRVIGRRDGQFLYERCV